MVAAGERDVGEAAQRADDRAAERRHAGAGPTTRAATGASASAGTMRTARSSSSAAPAAVTIFSVGARRAGAADQHLAVRARHQIAVAPEHRHAERRRRGLTASISPRSARTGIGARSMAPTAPAHAPAATTTCRARAARRRARRASRARRAARRCARTGAPRRKSTPRAAAAACSASTRRVVVERRIVGEQRAAAHGRVDLRVARAHRVAVERARRANPRSRWRATKRSSCSASRLVKARSSTPLRGVRDVDARLVAQLVRDQRRTQRGAGALEIGQRAAPRRGCWRRPACRRPRSTPRRRAGRDRPRRCARRRGSASSRAIAQPITPAPMTSTSGLLAGTGQL